MYIPGPAINIYGTSRFVSRKLFAETARIKRKPPKVVEDDTAGMLCWGEVGDLPSAEPVPEVSFEVVKEEHYEISRETTPVRIVNPDNTEQYVDALQTNKMSLEKTTPAEKNNSATESAEASGFTEREQDAFAPAEPATKKTQYTVTYKPPERAL